MQHLILIGSVSVADTNVWALAAGKDLSGRSGPKTFQRKVQIKKSAIETKLCSETCFYRVLVSIMFFFNVNLEIRLDNFTNDTVINFESVLYPWLNLL